MVSIASTSCGVGRIHILVTVVSHFPRYDLTLLLFFRNPVGGYWFLGVVPDVVSMQSPTVCEITFGVTLRKQRL